MIRNRGWDSYPAIYRAAEMQTLASWIAAGESGAVVGLPGCGRSNLLGFLFQRSDVLHTLIGERADRVVLVTVDLVNLPGNDLSNLYRTLLHALYWVRTRFPDTVAQVISELYLEQRAIQDPFLAQKALYDFFLICQQERLRVVMLFNRFDRFCQMVAQPANGTTLTTNELPMVNTLRSLRDSFKSTLCYIAGMGQETIYMADPAQLGDMYELLDSHICRVGALGDADARFMLSNELRTASAAPSEAETHAVLALSGRFPSLLRAVGQWWLLTKERPRTLGEWLEHLLAESSILYRLDRIWGGLTQEEKLALSQVQQQSKVQRSHELAEQNQQVLMRLHDKGLCFQQGVQWHVNGDLLARYIARLEGRVRGRIWLEEKTRMIFQGDQAVEDLSGIRLDILRFLLKNPRVKLTTTEIIDNAWPEELQREGIAPNALQVHIASIRKLIEPNPPDPRYLITWHGKPGGYQFFPEGKPE